MVCRFGDDGRGDARCQFGGQNGDEPGATTDPPNGRSDVLYNDSQIVL